jgi:hypothetical protein
MDNNHRLLKEYVRESLNELFGNDYDDRYSPEREESSWWDKLVKSVKSSLGLKTKNQYGQLRHASLTRRNLQSRRKFKAVFDKWLDKLGLDLGMDDDDLREFRRALLPPAEAIYNIALRKSKNDERVARDSLLKFLEDNYEEFLY